MGYGRGGLRGRRDSNLAFPHALPMCIGKERGAVLLAAEKLIPAAWLVFLSRKPHGFWHCGFGSAQHASPTLLRLRLKVLHIM